MRQPPRSRLVPVISGPGGMASSSHRVGATFGGDSSVYRSRRGIEKRLFQFTVVLAVLFVLFSIASFKLAQSTSPV